MNPETNFYTNVNLRNTLTNALPELYRYLNEINRDIRSLTRRMYHLNASSRYHIEAIADLIQAHGRMYGETIRHIEYITEYLYRINAMQQREHVVTPQNDNRFVRNSTSRNNPSITPPLHNPFRLPTSRENNNRSPNSILFNTSSRFMHSPLTNNLQPSNRNSLFNTSLFAEGGNERSQLTFFDVLLNELASQDLSPVPIVPSRRQIQQAVQIDRYDNFPDSTEIRCPITLDLFLPSSPVVQIRHCGHMFSQDGFDEWFQRNATCPICRYDIREYQPQENDNENNNENESENNNENESENNNENNDNSNLAQNDGSQETIPTEQIIGNNTPLDSSNNLATTLERVNTLLPPMQPTQQILYNLLTNNISNLGIDNSNNAITFDTYIQNTFPFTQNNNGSNVNNNNNTNNNDDDP